ncbi:MAG: hypothetical protein RLZZ324_1357 [Candidatus Parcubacteria bacterium]
MQLSGKRMPNRDQWKHLPKYLSLKEKFVSRLLIAAIVISLGAIGFKFANDNMVTVPADGGDYVEASVGNPRYINPVLASSNDADNDLVKLVFTGLMRTDAKGDLQPDLAEKYDVSADGTTYTFTLRKGILWHDGKPFTSKDLVSTVNDIRDPAWKSPLASEFKNVTVTAPDDRTVVFTLHEPFAPFLSMLTFGVLPDHLWSQIKPDAASRAELNIKPVGTGPFKFKSYDKDKKGIIHTYTLERNAAFYAVQPHLNTISFRFYDDFATAHDALLKRKADGISYLPLDYRDTVEKVRSLRAITLHLPQYTAVFLNEKRNAILGDKSVRQALSMAVDREAVRTAALQTDGVLVNSPILEGFVGYDDQRAAPAHDLVAAGKLLDAAGWVKADDGTRAKKGVDNKKKPTLLPLEIALTTVDAKEYQAAAAIVKQGWEQLGVKVDLDVVPASSIQKDKIRPRDYDALLYGEIIGSDPDPYPFWHSSQADENGLNLSMFNNRRADELLEKARTATSDDARVKMYGEFQDLLLADNAAIFLYSPTYTYAVSKKIKGLDEGMIYSPADRFAEAATWYVNTGRAWK